MNGPTSAAIFATDNRLLSYSGFWMGWGPNTLGVYYGDGGQGPAHRRSAAGLQVPVDQWIHVAAVVRGPDSTDFSLYANGVAIAHTYEGTGGPMVHDPQAGPNVGSWQLVAANQPWKGRLDDLRLYNCALDAAGVVAAMNASQAAVLTSEPIYPRPSRSAGIVIP